MGVNMPLIEVIEHDENKNIIPEVMHYDIKTTGEMFVELAEYGAIIDAALVVDGKALKLFEYGREWCRYLGSSDHYYEVYSKHSSPLEIQPESVLYIMLYEGALTEEINHLHALTSKIEALKSEVR